MGIVETFVYYKKWIWCNWKVSHGSHNSSECHICNSTVPIIKFDDPVLEKVGMTICTRCLTVIRNMEGDIITNGTISDLKQQIDFFEKKMVVGSTTKNTK